MRPSERDQIGSAGVQDCIDLRRFRDRTHCDGGDLRDIPHGFSQVRLEHATVDRLLVWNCLPGGNIDQVAARHAECLSDADQVGF